MSLNGIKRIKIKNIKGIEEKEFTFNDLLLANRANILVANNGFGKSSIAKAFEYLNDASIQLNNDDINLDNSLENPFVEIEYKINDNNIIKIADNEKNNIREDLEIEVINSKLRAGGTGGVAVLTTENIDICRIYEKVSFSYKLTDFLKDNNLNDFSKLFNLVTYIDNEDLLFEINDNKDYLNNTSLNKKIDNFLSSIDISMTKKEIFIQIVNENKINNILSSNAGNILFNLIKNYEIKNNCYISDENTLFNFIQIYYIYKDKKKINDKIKYIHSKNDKNYCIDVLKKCNTIKRGKIYEEHSNSKGKFLRLKLPKVSTISNGQRDLLCFVASFLKMVISGKSLKKMKICVIDEVFDYLDGANLLFIQYLISNFISQNKKSIPTVFIIMTHLDPEIFGTFRLKKQKIYYLDDTHKNIESNINLKNLIINRESLSNNFKDIFESKFIHYHPDNSYIISEFEDEELLFCEKQNSTLFFVLNMKENIKKYIEGKEYDPLLLACGLRYYCEMYQYNLLNNDEQKNAYINAHSTENKNEILDDYSISYDCTVDILSLLYNEMFHISEKTYNQINNKFVLRIESLVTRNIVKDFINKNKLF